MVKQGEIGCLADGREGRQDRVVSRLGNPPAETEHVARVLAAVQGFFGGRKPGRKRLKRQAKGKRT